MWSYEKEQERLLALWRDVSSDDEVLESESDDEEDHVSESDHNTDTEQEILEDDEPEIGQNIENEDSEHEIEQNLQEDISEGQNLDLENETLSSNTGNEEHMREARGRRMERFFIGKDGMKWSKTVPNKCVRTRKENIVSHLPCVKAVANQCKTEYECWSQFITNRMLDDIVNYTNIKIAEKAVNYKDKFSVKPTNKTEIKAVFGLLYLAGLFRSNRQNLNDLWQTDGTGIDIFRTTMTLKRFQFLLCCLRFDNILNRGERLKIDKLAPIRGIFDEFVANCKATYSPSQYLTIDEKLESFRGRCAFKQYIPNKPAKYGIKVQALVDARSYYVVNLEIYPGKQPEGPFDLPNTPSAIVERLIEPVSGTHRNITFDNWYTSSDLMMTLLEKHKLTSVGTVRKNKRCIPLEFLNVKNKEPNSTMFGFQKDLTIVAYTPKKNKVVLMLSTLHHDDKIDDQSDKKLPEVISFYNFTKCGVDVVDELSESYNVSRNSRRWPLTVFFSVLNTAAINAQVIFRENNDDFKTPRRKIIKRLGLQLLEDHVKLRRGNPRISRELRRKIGEIAGPSESEPPQKRPRNLGRCSVCPRKSDRKTKYRCHACESFICLEHTIPLCESCVTSETE